ncbi:zinc finger, GRF-type containing protein [Tanacetum coccineum]|uniref:Zinc finger, GRF-type containing protein n=1 Tax=Tanacetum coccineum TaxID=301880 RepID=A0ABQ5HY00_9ASTR
MALCFCVLPAVTRTSWADANPCRRFFGCPQIEGQRCIYFGWLDTPMCQIALMIIPGLLRARNRLEADMMVLVQANRKLKKYLILSSVAFALFLLLS